MPEPMRIHDAQRELNQAVLYALKSGCFIPVPDPKPGATVEELIAWGAMRNLHTAIRQFDLAGGWRREEPSR